MDGEEGLHQPPGPGPLLAYFITVFVAAPARADHRPRHVARAVHPLQIDQPGPQHPDRALAPLPPVTLVFATVALGNLNHVVAGRDDGSWVGFWIFAAAMVVVIVGWVAATPLTLRHPRIVQRGGYALIGPAQRLFEHLDATPGEYTESDISPYFWHKGQYPCSCRRFSSRSTMAIPEVPALVRSFLEHGRAA